MNCLQAWVLVGTATSTQAPWCIFLGFSRNSRLAELSVALNHFLFHQSSTQPHPSPPILAHHRNSRSCTPGRQAESIHPHSYPPIPAAPELFSTHSQLSALCRNHPHPFLPITKTIVLALGRPPSRVKTNLTETALLLCRALQCCPGIAEKFNIEGRDC